MNSNEQKRWVTIGQSSSENSPSEPFTKYVNHMITEALAVLRCIYVVCMVLKVYLALEHSQCFWMRFSPGLCTMQSRVER